MAQYLLEQECSEARLLQACWKWCLYILPFGMISWLGIGKTSIAKRCNPDVPLHLRGEKVVDSYNDGEWDWSRLKILFCHKFLVLEEKVYGTTVLFYVGGLPNSHVGSNELSIRLKILAWNDQVIHSSANVQDETTPSFVYVHNQMRRRKKGMFWNEWII